MLTVSGVCVERREYSTIDNLAVPVYNLFMALWGAFR